MRRMPIRLKHSTNFKGTRISAITDIQQCTAIKHTIKDAAHTMVQLRAGTYVMFGKLLQDRFVKHAGVNIYTERD